MQAKGNARPRRRPVARHPGIYYRPRPGGKVAPPYEVPYLDSTGKRRWAVVHGSLDDAEAKRAELRLRRRRGERIEPTRQTFEEYAREWLERQDVRPRTREEHSWALEQHLIPLLRPPPARPDHGRRRRRLHRRTCAARACAARRSRPRCGRSRSSSPRPRAAARSRSTPAASSSAASAPNHDDQRPKRILTLEEMQALLAGADSEQYRCLLELLLAAGLRIGEALGLAVGDLDRKHSLIRVECQLGRDGTARRSRPRSRGARSTSRRS